MAVLVVLCCCLCLCCLYVASTSLADGSPSYRLSWNFLGGGGGGSSSSAHYALSGTLGQGSAGAAASPGYRIGTGYWYALGIPVKPAYRIHLPLIEKNHVP